MNTLNRKVYDHFHNLTNANDTIKRRIWKKPRIYDGHRVVSNSVQSRDPQLCRQVLERKTEYMSATTQKPVLCYRLRIIGQTHVTLLWTPHASFNLVLEADPLVRNNKIPGPRLAFACRQAVELKNRYLRRCRLRNRFCPTIYSVTCQFTLSSALNFILSFDIKTLRDRKYKPLIRIH